MRNTRTLESIGLKPDGSYQEIDGFRFYPREYFAPKYYVTGRMSYLTRNTVSSHHYDASWQTDDYRKEKQYIRILGSRFGGKAFRIMTLIRQQFQNIGTPAVTLS